MGGGLLSYAVGVFVQGGDCPGGGGLVRGDVVRGGCCPFTALPPTSMFSVQLTNESHRMAYPCACVIVRESVRKIA